MKEVNMFDGVACPSAEAHLERLAAPATGGPVPMLPGLVMSAALYELVLRFWAPWLLPK